MYSVARNFSLAIALNGQRDNTGLYDQGRSAASHTPLPMKVATPPAGFPSGDPGLSFPSEILPVFQA